jgi:hypothetical protein
MQPDMKTEFKHARVALYSFVALNFNLKIDAF